jgi:hypothetical protein
VLRRKTAANHSPGPGKPNPVPFWIAGIVKDRVTSKGDVVVFLLQSSPNDLRGLVVSTQFDVFSTAGFCDIGFVMESETILRLSGDEPNCAAEITGIDSTRYLCAGAHLDRTFRLGVIESLVEERHRAVEIPVGVDIEAVVRHALLAERRLLGRNLLLLPVFLLGAFYLISFATQDSYTRQLSNVMYALWLIAAVIVFFENLAKSSTLRSLRKGGNGVSYRGTGTSSQPSPLACEGEGNLVVYSGFSPFVGAGYEIGGWSFVIRLDSQKQDLGVRLEPIPFKDSELYAHMRSRLEELELKELQIKDKLYVNGQDVREDVRFMPDPMAPPKRKIDRSIVDAFEDDPSQAVRHYMGIHLIQWKGEVVVSCFLRINQQGYHLFVEASYFLLPPVKEDYYSVDALPPDVSARELFGFASSSIISGPVLCAIAPFAIWAKVNEAWRRSAARNATEQMIKQNHSFDYGCRSTIRSIAASTNYRRYFQKLDKEMGVKLVARCVLDSLVDFLDGKNVDTSEIKERTSVILNNGVIVSGGSIQAETFTAGQGAISKVTQSMGRTAASGHGKAVEKG